MSEAILVIGMQESCDECVLSSIAYDSELFEEGECYCIVKMKSVNNTEEGSKPYWCPLRPMPEKKMMKGDVHNVQTMGEELVAAGWNSCIDVITGSRDK